ncbi:MAG: type IV secretion system DNA-binding domain-containing protein [bacterium]|nr:type IV secretion system DNA-binding domain-containing protein [bacterium]
MVIADLTSTLVNALIIALVSGLVAGLFVMLGQLAFVFFRNRNREERSLDSVLLEVAVPRNNEIKIDAAEQMFASLYSVKKGGWKTRFDIQDVVSFELVAKPEEIRFYVWCPRRLQDLVEKQIHGAYPDAQVTPTQEYNLFSEEGKVAYTSFQFKSGNFYPIKIYKDLPTDPLSSITSALAKMGEGERAAIQVLISPADSFWKKLGGSFIAQTKKAEADPEKAAYKVDAKTLEEVDNKISKPGFETTIRVVVSAPTEEGAKAHLANMKSAFEQFSGEHNSFRARKIRYKASFVTDFLYRYHPMLNLFGNKKMVLNSEELATIFHFPNKQITTPHIFWLNAKSAPAPAEIATEGLYIGQSAYRGIKRPVYLQEDDRRRHMYIVGKTGTGKTELLKDLIMQDIKAGHGICFMDPHGDAVRDLLKLIPPERADDVIYFNPGDTERPMGLNLLEAKTEDQKHFVATSVINMMYKLYDPYKTGIIGPRFEHAVRNAILTVFAEEGATFVEVVRVLTDPSYVQELLPKIEDPIVKRYWTDQIAQTAEFHKSEVLDYIVSKFGRFVTNKMMRNIIGQSQSAFNFRDVMDNGKILLVNLAKGELGEENSNFLGLVLVPRILMAAMSRQDVPEDQRRDFYLYVDEFQNFATPDFAQILSEARKYRLNLTVANQFIGQVDEEVKNAVFGNVGTLMCFRVGVTDANYLAREFTPVFAEDDLLNIERFHVYMKTTVNNEPVPPFSVGLTKDIVKEKAMENERVAEIIREMSRLKFGRDRALVEAEVARRAKL